MNEENTDAKSVKYFHYSRELSLKETKMGAEHYPEPTAPPCPMEEVTIVVIEDRRDCISWVLNVLWVFNGGYVCACRTNAQLSFPVFIATVAISTIEGLARSCRHALERTRVEHL